jgi:hypothetical protein
MTHSKILSQNLATHSPSKAVALAAVLAMTLGLGAGCASSGPPVKSQSYAVLKNTRNFESDFSVVWKAIENSMRGLKVTDRDPETVDANEMRKLSHRTLKTDWFYTQSRDKYQQYESNGSPRKVYLQTRIKYEIDARRVMGGVDVTVSTSEEVEKLKKDGTPDGYDKADQPDPSRASEILDKIQGGILSATP